MNMKKYDEGVKETELGIQLGTKEPERAWYNLGIGYERLGNIQKAYESYRQASVLDPKWQDPKDEWPASRAAGQEVRAQCPEPEVRQQMGSSTGRTSGSIRTLGRENFPSVASDSEIRIAISIIRWRISNRHASPAGRAAAAPRRWGTSSLR